MIIVTGETIKSRRDIMTFDVVLFLISFRLVLIMSITHCFNCRAQIPTKKKKLRDHFVTAHGIDSKSPALKAYLDSKKPSTAVGTSMVEIQNLDFEVKAALKKTNHLPADTDGDNNGISSYYRYQVLNGKEKKRIDVFSNFLEGRICGGNRFSSPDEWRNGIILRL